MPFFRFETQALQNGVPNPRQLLRFVCHGVRPLVTLPVTRFFADPSLPLCPIAYAIIALAKAGWMIAAPCAPVRGGLG